jgi:hypothetical protein
MSKPVPGKFEGNESLEIAEFLFDIELDGGAYDDMGDVETFGFHSLHLSVNDFNHYISHEVSKLVKPAYITWEDNNGFFTYIEFDSNAEAKAAWRKLEVEFAELQETYA